MIKQLIDLLSLVLAVLSVPVILVCIYDQLVLGPKRPLTAEGVPEPGPRYVQIAYSLLPYVIIGALVQIGMRPVFAWFKSMIVPLSFLAIPVVLLCAYDHWVAAPRRPKTREGFPMRPALYVRIAYAVLPFVLLAVVLNIGVPVVFGWIKEISVPLSWLAAPVGVWCALDSWLFAPRRAIAAGSAKVADPPVLRAAYAVLPVLVVAVIVRMISAETLDFSLVLLVLSIATGAVWAIDHFLFRKPREAAAAAAKPPLVMSEPGTVDYARSFFPVAFIVLLVRAFIFEPFRIPSDSMMPTLLDGDFIVVNKYSYGLRWPVINEKFFDVGSPQRGDVVVFRYPPDPSMNYIKRLVGLPGDRVEVRDDQLIVNGETIPMVEKGRFTDGCYIDFRLSTEQLGAHTHEVMSCRSPIAPISVRDYGGSLAGLPVCNRQRMAANEGAWICRESPPGSGADRNDFPRPNNPVVVVPAGNYLMIGDNRDNSADSRSWGFVSEANLVGKATRIWFNFDMQRPEVFNWERIGQGIE